MTGSSTGLCPSPWRHLLNDSAASFFARHCKTTIAADLTCRLMKGPMLCRCSTRGYEGAGTHRPKAYTHMRLHGDTNMNHASWNTGCADSMRGRSHIDCPGVICNSLLCFQSGAHTGRATSAAAKALQEQALKWIGLGPFSCPGS